ncbi:MAG: enoyl-CoA hydratase/isomerase family protein [Burkholderiales bacterium]|nr:enoyl-CoA hydratase/isomerase family protein [Burkholderiales bacterium]
MGSPASTKYSHEYHRTKMIDEIPLRERAARLTRAGLAESAVQTFLRDLESAQAQPAAAGGLGLRGDSARLGQACRRGRELLARLPARSKRNAGEKAAGHAVVHLLADAVWRFFRAYRKPVYDILTAGRTRALRLEELAWAGAELLPGILPTQAELAAESLSMQMDKDGLEIHQGMFFGQLLSDREIGLHMCMAMLLPTAAARARLEEFQSSGKLDLGAVRLEAKADAGYLYFHHPRYLNAEDDDTLTPQETACDLVLMHPGLRMGVLRGAPVEHPKYKGRRIFSAGINLTRIYQGKQSYLFYLTRDMGLLNKMFRGLAATDQAGRLELRPDEPEQTLEKPWVAVLDGFAIGGGCQLLLVMDYVIAESGAYFNLPARKEGIIPGCANLRLPRYMGERMARQAIMFDKTFQVDDAEARTLVNEVHAREDMDRAVEACIANALGSGMVSAGGNRKAIRIQTEPLDTFRAYMATYAYEQSFCHLSEQLVHNLERHWNAKERKL